MIKKRDKVDNSLMIIAIVAIVAIIVLMMNRGDGINYSLDENGAIVGLKGIFPMVVPSKDINSLNLNSGGIDEIISCIISSSGPASSIVMMNCVNRFDLNGDGSVNVLDIVTLKNRDNKFSITKQKERFRQNLGRGDASLSIQSISINEGSYPAFTGNLKVRMVNAVDVAGFQFEIHGVRVTGVSAPSSASDNGMDIDSYDLTNSHGYSLVLGYGDYENFISENSNTVIITVHFSGEYDPPNLICFGTNDPPVVNNVVSDTNAEAIATSWGDCGLATFYGCFHRTADPFLTVMCPDGYSWVWTGGFNVFGECCLNDPPRDESDPCFPM